MEADICTIEDNSQGSCRGVHFIKLPSVKHANALSEFERMPEKAQWYFKTSFDYWISGLTQKKRFHGFDGQYKKGRYKDCFVFKNIAEKSRLYGFLSRPKSGGESELCILVLFCQKKEDKTDETMLDRVNEIRLRPDVVEAIKVFRTKPKGL